MPLDVPSRRVVSSMYQVSSDKPKKITSFTQLNAWKKSHELAVEVYKMTKDFPKSEQYGLVSQLQRAASSIGANISEGFSRSTKADKKHFFVMSHGSLSETQNFLLLARDISYIKDELFKKLADLTVEVSKLINGLIKSLDNGKGAKA